MLRVLVVAALESERDSLCDTLAMADPLLCLAGACGTYAEVARWWKAQSEPPSIVFTTRALPDGSPLTTFVGATDTSVILLLQPGDDSVAFLRLHRVPFLTKPVNAMALTAVIERFRLAGPAFAGRFADYVADTKPVAKKKTKSAGRPKPSAFKQHQQPTKRAKRQAD